MHKVLLYTGDQHRSFINSNSVNLHWSLSTLIEEDTIKNVIGYVGCKDYIMDCFYRDHDSFRTPTVETIKNTQWYVTIVIPSNIEANKAAKRIIEHFNPYEKEHGFELTEVITDIEYSRKNVLCVKIPKDWFKVCLTPVSIYLSLIRLLIIHGDTNLSNLAKTTVYPHANEVTYYKQWNGIANDPRNQNQTKYQFFVKFLDKVHNDPLWITKYFDDEKYTYTGASKFGILSLHGMCGVFFAVAEAKTQYYTQNRTPLAYDVIMQEYKNEVENEMKRIKAEQEAKKKLEEAKAVMKTAPVKRKKKVTTDVKVQSVQRTTKRPRTPKTA